MKNEDDRGGRLQLIEDEVNQISIGLQSEADGQPAPGQIRIGDKFVDMRVHLESSKFVRYLVSKLSLRALYVKAADTT